jgi:hypothetical protein
MHAKEPHRSGGVPASHAACSKGSSATGGRMRRSRLARTPEAALLISAQRPAGVSAEGPAGPNEARRERGRDYTKEGNLHLSPFLSPFSARTLNARVILAASDVWPPPAAHPHRLPTTAPLCPHAGRAVRKSRAADPLRMRHRKPDRFSDAHIASQTLPATVRGLSPHATSSDTARSAGRSPGRTLSLPEEDSGSGAIRDPCGRVAGMRPTRGRRVRRIGRPSPALVASRTLQLSPRWPITSRQGQGLVVGQRAGTYSDEGDLPRCLRHCFCPAVAPGTRAGSGFPAVSAAGAGVWTAA